MTHSLMKSLVVDYHKGKEEIGSMDDELPLMIYIILNANIDHVGAELHFVEDYVNVDPMLESDKRLMTNLTVNLADSSKF
jgi:Vacuolar sorting protein 9 (VPS9) domain